ncbi:hypothetical protein OSS47_28345 [Pseudomonas citronellolis]|uniref:hypothetical protein n=1 Tax=Pseudomonas citronellolis TaxID=53408 RepID=UPI00226E9037|nr:hypothetical protein [Pseudomonas citronellolis]WAB91980.1 hypothetical protein OSS47_28345 [Pseudomonas citronellolis]
MKAVLYTHDLEPITVIDLEPWAWEFLEQHGSVVLQVQTPPTIEQLRNPMLLTMQMVRITAEKLIRRNHRTLMLFTADEEPALLLKSAFLAGQNRDVQERERAAFARGFLHALNALGR